MRGPKAIVNGSAPPRGTRTTEHRTSEVRETHVCEGAVSQSQRFDHVLRGQLTPRAFPFKRPVRSKRAQRWPISDSHLPRTIIPNPRQAHSAANYVRSPLTDTNELCGCVVRSSIIVRSEGSDRPQDDSRKPARQQAWAFRQGNNQPLE